MRTKLLATAILVIFLSVQLIAQSNMWALTHDGGAYSMGSLISMDPATAAITVQHSFQSPQGFHPYGNLLQANDGNLYGTCYDGGQYASCTIFRFEPGSSTYTDVYAFDIIHGDFPTSGVIQGPGNILYGAASHGGTSGAGVIYSYNTFTEVYSVEYNFNAPTGSVPYGPPVLHSNGKLYGMTQMGGLTGSGTVYSYDPATQTYSMLFSLSGNNGETPYGSLVEASDGNLYGMTAEGGTNNNGVLFRYSPVTNMFTKLIDFTTSVGTNPKGTLIEASDGLLYGTASTGGLGGGTLFSYNITTNTLTNIHSLSTADGTQPIGDLYESGGYLYGTSHMGGQNAKGTAYRISLQGYAFTKLVDFNNANGSGPMGAFMIQVPTGIPAVASDQVEIYPNPVATNMKIHLPKEFTSGVKISVTDLTGKMVMEKSFSDIPQGSMDLDMQQLQSGAYFINLESGHDSYRQKFVKY